MLDGLKYLLEKLSVTELTPLTSWLGAGPSALLEPDKRKRRALHADEHTCTANTRTQMFVCCSEMPKLAVDDSKILALDMLITLAGGKTFLLPTVLLRP